jgi:hypothetical protein
MGYDMKCAFAGSEEEEGGDECESEGDADFQQEGSLSEGGDIMSEDDLDDDAEDIVFDNSESDMSLAGSDEELGPRNKKTQRTVCICSQNFM